MIKELHATSFSQNNLFEQCPRTWYYSYILKIPGISDMCYAWRGTAVHNVLEKYYPEKKLTTKELKMLFHKEWFAQGLQNTKLKDTHVETWQMVLNGKNLDLDVTGTELKIAFPDVTAFIDIVDENKGQIYDWKTSTRREENEKEYEHQVKFYSWLFYRKYNKMPTDTKVFYLKYTDKRKELSFKVTKKDIEEVEEWHKNIRERMKYFIQNPEKLPPFNTEYYFCPYKHLWNLTTENSQEFTLVKTGSSVFIREPIDDLLNEHLNKKFSFEPANSYYIQKKFPNIDTAKYLWNKKYRRISIGFIDELMKTLNDYAVWKKKNPVIKIIDSRKTDNTEIVMPEKLLSGKILRDYQEDAVTKYIAKHETGVLELATGAGKTLIAMEIIRKLNLKTLFVVEKNELVKQTIKAIRDNLGIEPGIIAEGKCELGYITVATIQSLNSKKDELKEYFDSVRFLVVDETHHASAISYYNLSNRLNNTIRRLGITATFRRNDGYDMMLKGVVGDIILKISAKELIRKGYLMEPKIFFIQNFNTSQEMEVMERLSYRKGTINEEPTYAFFYEQFIKNNEQRNLLVKNLAEKHKDARILILVKLVDHGEKLKELISGSEYINGKTPKKLREKQVEEFKEGTLKVLIATISIFSEGVDVPELDVMINASANKGDIKSVQSIGRVLRKHDTKDSATYYDFFDQGIFFYKTSRARIDAFRKEEYSVKYLEAEEMHKR